MAREFFVSYGIDIDAQMEKIQFESKGASEYHLMLPQRTFTPNQQRSSKHDSAIHLNDDDSTIMPTDSDVSIDRTSPPKLRSAKHSSTHTFAPLTHPACVTCIRGARLPRKPLLWDIHLRAGRIRGIEPHDFNSASQVDVPGVMEVEGRLVAHSLCHA